MKDERKEWMERYNDNIQWYKDALKIIEKNYSANDNEEVIIEMLKRQNKGLQTTSKIALIALGLGIFATLLILIVIFTTAIEVSL